MGEPARFSYRHHLVRLIIRTEVAAARLAEAPGERVRALVPHARRVSARLSARLDASPLTDETARQVDAGRYDLPVPRRAPTDSDAAAASATSEGGWASALKLEGMPTQDVAAVEYANLLACHETEEQVAGEFFAAPLSVLTHLHGRIVEGMVDPDLVGRLRRTEQDVHDGAQGQVIYRTPAPDALPGLLEDLLTWVGRGSAGVPAVVVAGVIHGRLLEWQPFVAANGRLARAAARVVLRARGVDPLGVAVPERLLARDVIGYYGEVAASIRRRGDLTAWLERTGEAAASALEAAADEAAGVRPEPPSRAVRYAASMSADHTVTLPEYAAAADVDRDTASEDLEMLVRARLLAVVTGTQGLRLRRTDTDV